MIKSYPGQYRADIEAQKLFIITGRDHQSYLLFHGPKGPRYGVKPRIQERYMRINLIASNAKLLKSLRDLNIIGV